MPPQVSVADVLSARAAQSPEAIAQREEAWQKALQAQQLHAIEQSVISSTKALISYLDGKVTKTEVVNQLQQIGTPDALKVVEAVNSLHATLKTHKDTDLSEITGVMKQVLEEAKQIPKTLPDAPKFEQTDYSKQFSGLIDAVKSVESVVKAQKLEVKAPIVNVKPEVKVDAPNLTPLQVGLSAVEQAVKSIAIPEYKATDVSGVEKLLKSVDKRLKDLPDQMPVRGGGGGGGIASYKNSTGNVDQVALDSLGNVPVSPFAAVTMKRASISASNSGDNVVVAAVTNKKLKVISVVLVAAGTVSVKWRSNSTDLSGAMPLVVNSGFVLPPAQPGGHYLETATGETLNINLSGGVAVTGHISYYEE